MPKTTTAKPKAAPSSAEPKLLVEAWPITGPKPYPNNPRVISDAAVAKVAASISTYGFRQPLVVNPQGVIIVGHTRLLAAKKLGLGHVPVHVAHGLTAEQEAAYRLADNRTAEEAEWDLDKLADEMRDLPAELPTGFDPSELDKLLGDELELGDPDEVPDLDESSPPISQRGEVYELGPHRLMCGDATSDTDWNALCGSETIDMCFTSPPYGAAKTANLRDHYVRGAEKRESFYDEHDDDPGQWLELMRGWTRCMTARCELVICNVQMLADNKRSMVEWLHDVRASLIDVVIWDKVNGAPQMAANVMSNAFEFIFLIGGNGSRAVPFADFHGTIANVVRIDPRREQNEHADHHRAVMPTALAEWALRDLCPRAKVVAEPFAGTGTTIIAASRSGKRCRAMELSPAYCDVIRRRWTAFAAANQIEPGSGALTP